MRSGIYVPVGRTHRDPKRMVNFWQNRIIDLVVANQTRQNRQSRSVCRSPSVGPTVVRVHIEESTRASEPFCLGRVVVNIEKLIQVVAVSIDNQQMTVLAAATINVPGIATLDPVRLCDGFRRDRIERKADISWVSNAVTFAGVGKLHSTKVSIGDV